MEDSRANQIIRLRDREKQKQDSFWGSLWQSAADLCYPREDQINQQTSPGQDKSLKVLEATGVFYSQQMASGLFGFMVPSGQKFFSFTALGESGQAAEYWLAAAPEALHTMLFDSNFALQLIESLHSAIVFGTANLQSEELHRQLNFKDHAIGTYQFKESASGQVDTVIHSYTFTARQAMQKFGKEACSKEIVEAAGSMDHESDRFSFIHIVRPREAFNALSRRASQMPFESIHVDVKAKTIVRERGNELLPFHVARWQKGSTEKFGRGQGTECVSDLRMLQQMRHDQIDLWNKFANPPLMVDPMFEGTVKTYPGAINRGRSDMVEGLKQTVLGNPLMVDQELEAQRKLIRTWFFADVFTPITNLSGTHRTAQEIEARRQEGLRLLASPAARLQSELFTPLIMRALHLMIRAHRIPPPPQSLRGVTINYLGPLALALLSQQTTGFMQSVTAGAQLAAVDPSVMDNLNLDRGFRRFVINSGAPADLLATEAEMAAKRQARAQQQQAMAAQQLAETAAAGGKAYQAGTKAPEAGSVAGQMMEAANA